MIEKIVLSLRRNPVNQAALRSVLTLLGLGFLVLFGFSWGRGWGFLATGLAFIVLEWLFSQSTGGDDTR